MSGKNRLCVTNEIIEEYIEILQKLIGYEVSEYIVKVIINSPFTDFFTPYYHFELIKADPDDNKFVDCAIVAHAKYIVTNDHHYNILREIPFPKVEIISIQNFMTILEGL
ncbi:MAG: PIN domain-containing protein [Prevotella salivae]|nr:PIN domain-containing protein [Segatella salivae]